MMQSNKSSESYWRPAFAIYSVWLNILLEASELTYIGKREQSSKLWNNKNPIYFEMKLSVDSVQPAFNCE